MGQCRSKNQLTDSINASTSKSMGNKRVTPYKPSTSTNKRQSYKVVTYDNHQIKNTQSSSDSTEHSIDTRNSRHARQPVQNKISQKYEVLSSVTGFGVAGEVRPCIHRKTREMCAVKSIDKRKIKRADRIRREVNFLSQLSHPSIIRAYDVFEDERSVHIVTEMCHGGELFDRIVEKTQQGKICFPENEAARIIQSLLSAVSYLHRNDVIHRDIKPENILFTTKDDRSEIKLIDFGLSIRHGLEQKPLSNVVGTAYYMAPELLNGSYDRACDLWSVGIIAYTMICGRPPFNGASDEEIFNKIKNSELTFSSPAWDRVSVFAKDFIRCLINHDPSKRWTADMAIQHPWLKVAMLDPSYFPQK